MTSDHTARRGDRSSQPSPASPPPPAQFRRALLAWYDAGARPLPWRVPPADRARGVRPDPYRVWLSEIMLQQTTVAAATPYWRRFVERFETVEALAAAPRDDVLSAWAGLGYYARARNLHACAVEVAARGGAFPDTEDELRALPGIGAYTAAAIAAVCFDRPANVVDGNVERVMARIHAVDAPLPKAKPALKALAAPLADPDRPGDYAQALMDLGATVCTPRSPRCELCPVATWCAARRAGVETEYPKKAPKRAKPVRHGAAFILVGPGPAVWLEQRPETGLLGGMAQPIMTDWREEPWGRKAIDAASPAPAAGRAAAPVSHVFSHFRLELEVRRLDVEAAPNRVGWWAPIDALDREALPSVMRKAVEAGLALDEEV